MTENRNFWLFLAFLKAFYAILLINYIVFSSRSSHSMWNVGLYLICDVSDILSGKLLIHIFSQQINVDYFVLVSKSEWDTRNRTVDQKK